MKRMGVRELRAHMSDAIREVKGGQTIEVTSNGEVVALLVPAKQQRSQEEISAALADLDNLIAEIGKHQTAPTDVAELLSDMRR